MRGFLAVARREIAENRVVFVVGLIASMGPMAVPFVRNLHGAEAREAWALASFFGAVALAGGLSIAFGVSTLSRGISNRQIGFFFARPLSSLTIWSGKLTGIAALALAAALIEILPYLLASGGRLPMPLGWSLWPLLGLALLLIPVSHALSVALRSRTAWLALDLALAVLAALIVGLSTRTLRRELADHALERGLIGLAIVLTAAFLAAGFAAVARGRTEIRAAHRALSTTLWAVLAFVAASALGYERWVSSAGPKSLTAFQILDAGRRGEWIVVTGSARGADAGFLWNLKTGRYRRFPLTWRRPSISPDGSRATWFERDSPLGPFRLMTLDLSESDARPVRTGLTFLRLPADEFLSPKAERIAVITRGALFVYDVQTAKVVLSRRVAPERRDYGEVDFAEPSSGILGFFRDPVRLRLFRPGAEAPRLEIIDIDTAQKRTWQGALEDLSGPIVIKGDLDGKRLLVDEKAGSRISLVDGAGIKVLATLRRGPQLKLYDTAVLADGRVALAIGEPDGTRIEFFSLDGQSQGELRLPSTGAIFFGCEAAPGKQIVSVGIGKGAAVGNTVYVVDAVTREARRVAVGLFPATMLAGLRGHVTAEPGGEVTRLFYSWPDLSLVHFDPLTGERRVILPGHAH